VAADYSATIKLIVEGQQKLTELQNQVTGFSKQLKELARLDVSGVFEDPLTGGAVAKLRAARKDQLNTLKQTGQQQASVNRGLENQLLNQIRLNSAVDLYKRRLNEVGRTAAPEQKQFQGRLQELEEAFQFFRGQKSVSGVQAVATELGRIVEYSREVTRLELGRTKSSQQIKDYYAQISKLQAAGLDTRKVEATLEKFAVNAGTNKYALAEKYRVTLDANLKTLKDELRTQEKINKELAVAAKNRRARTKEAVSSGIIGGAFPLLFGQGIGASVGGGVGGAVGGLMGGQLGFGLSLVGTALGSQFDLAVQGAIELGKALQEPIKNFEQLKDKALISSKALEKEIEVLIQAGFTATASAAIQQDINERLGPTAVRNLQELAAAQNEFNRATSAATAQLQVLITNFIGLAPILKGLASGAQINALQTRAQNTITELRAQGKGQAAGKLEEVFGRTRLTAITPEEYAQQLNDALAEAEKSLKPVKIKLSPAQVREETISILQKQLEVLDITKKFSEAANEQREFDRQRYDLVQGYEESIAAIRRRVEDEITNKRLALIQKENELLNIQASIRQESLAISNMQARATAGAGLPTAARDVARQAAEAVGSFQEKELSLAEQAAKLKRDAALEALRTDIEAAKFQADTAREVSKLNIETAKKVAQFNESVRRQNQQQDTRRFEIEKQLAYLRLQNVLAEVSVLQNIAPTDEQFEAAGALLSATQSAMSYVEAQKAPTPISTTGGPAIQGVSLAGINSLNQQLKITQERINAAQLALNDLLALQNAEDFKAKMLSIAENIDAPLTQFAERLVEEEANRTRYIELVRQGIKGVVAEQIIQVENMRDQALLQYDAVIATLEEQKARKGVTDAVRAQIQAEIDLQEARKGEIAGEATTAITQVKNQDRGKALQEYITNAQEGLNDLEARAVRVADGIGNAIGNSMAQGITGLIEGTQSAQEVFANFLRNIADILMQESTRMIAQYIVLGIARAFGLGTPPNLSPRLSTGIDVPIGQMPAGMQFRANGGSVSAGSPYIVGERGPELFVPGRSGTIVPNDKLSGDNLSVVVNVDAKGTSVQGNDQQGNQLGRVISDAVQQELIRQKRPGGLLA